MENIYKSNSNYYKSNIIQHNDKYNILFKLQKNL